MPKGAVFLLSFTFLKFLKESTDCGIRLVALK